MSATPKHRPLHDVPDDSPPASMPVDPDQGPMPAALPDDPEDDRVTDPEA